MTRTFYFSKFFPFPFTSKCFFFFSLTLTLGGLSLFNTSAFPQQVGFPQNSVRSGYTRAMTPYWQPNMMTFYNQKILDYYGSGDVNNDGTISLEDADLIDNGQVADTNYRADTDGNGTINSQDSKIIKDYLNGTISHMPSDWNHSTRSERISWLKKMLAIDPGDQHPPERGVYECGDFARRAEVDLFGLQNFENSVTYEKYTWHGNYNHRFNIPVYVAYVISNLNGVKDNHAINAVLVGPNNDSLYKENPEDFTQWIFFEPQTDSIVKPGDWDMDINSHVRIYEFVYVPEFGSYSDRPLIDFQLNNGIAGEPTYINQYMTAFNPALDSIPPTAVWPKDSTFAWVPGLKIYGDSLAQKDFPRDLKDNNDKSIYAWWENWSPETKFFIGPATSYSITSTQGDSGTCAFINYDIYIDWVIKDLAQNIATHRQIISVRDLEKPYFKVPSDTSITTADDTSAVALGIPTNFGDNSGLGVIITHRDSIVELPNWSYDIYRKWKASDKCGNDSIQIQKIHVGSPTGTGPLNHSSTALLKVAPVPVRDVATFTFSTEHSGTVSFSIFDIYGRLVEAFSLRCTPGVNTFRHDLSHLAPGVYTIRFSDGSRSGSVRIVVGR